MVEAIDTLRKVFESGYVINAHCRTCGRNGFLDLTALIAAGHGERRLVGLRLRCVVCRGRGELSLIWPGR